MNEIERIAAQKFIDTKGIEYIDSSKYTMSKNTTTIESTNEMKFDFFISKAKHKNPNEGIMVDETVSWDEIVSIYVNMETGESRIA